jgi:hypothetical protein
MIECGNSHALISQMSDAHHFGRTRQSNKGIVDKYIIDTVLVGSNS